MTSLAQTLALLERELKADSPAGAPSLQGGGASEGAGEEEDEYVLVEFDGVAAHELRGVLSLQDLHTDSPSATLGHRLFHASYDEDIGSTLLFDRATLKRLANERTDEAWQQAGAEGGALVAVTTKRLRCTPVGYLPSSAGEGREGAAANSPPDDSSL
ncbi:hypothetical protein AB1Y20_016102 [Prymnesium parvum]|uniref:Transcription factor TFIIIC triple barrel domain-containing protein n=1 Tax=Prymnesium parvum TaxID=97485 RepID=A0AB34JZN7_PRYPA